MVDPPAPRAPRYLRFVTALVLGTAAATAVAACEEGDGDDVQPIDAAVDAPIDAAVDTPADAPIDTPDVVDGPLPPPDLPRAMA